jgi:hypothetical protein
MQHFDNLLQFVAYCETVTEDTNDLFLISALAAHLTKEDLIDDVNRCLEVYYFWLKEAINQELYYMAAQIVTAKTEEINHYIKLANAVLKQDIKADIIQVDAKLNKERL